MWLRRLGVPHLWPSRVKVFFLGGLTSAVIFSVFQYLHGANVQYLDFDRPASNHIVCKLPKEECKTAADPLKCTAILEDRQFWRGLNLSDPCPIVPTSLQGQTCLNPVLPLTSISGDLGSLRTVNSGVNPFKLWSVLFLILTSLLSFSIVIHDMALLEVALRPRILSLPNMRYEAPRLWRLLFCVNCMKRMRGLRRRNRMLWTVVLPLWNLVWALSFMVILYPISLISCFVSPVPMSRIMVFLSGILCMMWSIIFCVMTLVDTHTYAVLWDVWEPQIVSSCICWCEFPLSRSVLLRMNILALAVCFSSFNLTFRALRGLRRGQWANMFSVLYAVPIEAFPVSWERPDEVGGGPPKWREKDQPIQAEPAFDPFCLMDEQPESGTTRVQFMPTRWTDDRLVLWASQSAELDTQIGCCGFPRPLRADEDILDMSDDEEATPASSEPAPQVVGKVDPRLELKQATYNFESERGRLQHKVTRHGNTGARRYAQVDAKGVEVESLASGREDPGRRSPRPEAEDRGAAGAASVSEPGAGGGRMGAGSARSRRSPRGAPGAEAGEAAPESPPDPADQAAGSWRRASSPTAADPIVPGAAGSWRRPSSPTAADAAVPAAASATAAGDAHGVDGGEDVPCLMGEDPAAVATAPEAQPADSEAPPSGELASLAGRSPGRPQAGKPPPR